jgi:hypothetical protein
MNAKRLLVAGAVAVVLGFPLALGTLRVIAPPYCDTGYSSNPDGSRTEWSFCWNPNPWTGRYTIDQRGVPVGVVVSAQPRPAPTLYPFWVEAAIVVWLLLIGAGRMRGVGNRELALVSVVAVILAFPLALVILGWLAPPICPFTNVCATVDPWRGLYRYQPSYGFVGSPYLETPTPPNFLLVWVPATISVGVVLLVAGQLSGRLATAGPTTGPP